MPNSDFSVIIPSYNPDEKLITVIDGLEQLGINDIIVVNDGSKKECLSYFNEALKHSSVTLLTHEANKGKGAALKTAFSYFLKNRPNYAGCVTADGDAQHTPKDIVACASCMCEGCDEIVLGVRNFSLPNVPPRSRTGNKITSFVFKVFVGLNISDTQTGLRAFPREHLEAMCNVSGDRYEYETNMLLEIKKKKIPYSEITIDTVYIEENKTSHFNPIKDSWRIYKLILAHFFKYSVSSLICLLIEQIIQTVTYAFTVGKFTEILTEVISFLPGRIISSVVNYILNKKFVFDSDGSGGHTLFRYYILWTCQAILTMALDWIIVTAIPASVSYIAYALITLLIKTVIAAASFRIQKDWVFAKSASNGRK